MERFTGFVLVDLPTFATLSLPLPLNVISTFTLLLVQWSETVGPSSSYQLLAPNRFIVAYCWFLISSTRV